jgi:hemoglobin/transferrin/lactoferrin receptor protein
MSPAKYVGTDADRFRKWGEAMLRQIFRGGRGLRHRLDSSVIGALSVMAASLFATGAIAQTASDNPPAASASDSGSAGKEPARSAPSEPVQSPPGSFGGGEQHVPDARSGGALAPVDIRPAQPQPRATVQSKAIAIPMRKPAIVQHAQPSPAAKSTATAQRARPAPATQSSANSEAIGSGSDQSGNIVGPLGGQYPQPKSLHQVTQSVTVVDRKEIELTAPASTLDILSAVPGVSIARSGGIGGQIYLRGFSSNSMRSPLFIDGDRLHGRNTLQYQYFQPEEIERVEVIRGPASVLYGSDALTGVVNLIMRHPTISFGPATYSGGVTAGYGSAANSTTTYSWAQATGGGFAVMGGYGTRAGSNYDTPLGSAINSDYKTEGGNLNVAWAPAIGQRVEFTLRDYKESDGRAGGVGGAPGYPYLNVRQSPNDLRMGRLAYTGDFTGIAVKHVEASFYANYFDTHVLTVNTSTPGKVVNSDNHVMGPLVIGGKALTTFGWDGMFFGDLKSTFGMDGWNEARPGSTSTTTTETLTATGQLKSVVTTPLAQVVPDSGQSNIGVFMLHEWTPVAPFTLSAGGRYDWFNTWTLLSPLASPALLPAYQKASNVDVTAPTGSIGGVYRITPLVDLIGDVATSFRQPTNMELFNSTATTIPNPNLQPETGLTYEGGFRFHLNQATVKVTTFDSLYHNLILAVPIKYNGSSAYTQNQNVGDAEIQGIEIEERWQLTPAFNIFGNATMLRGTNTTTDMPLAYISPFHGRSGVQYAPPGAGYSFMTFVDWASAKTRIDPTQEYPTAAYAVWNMFATFELGTVISPALGDTRVTLGLENILNALYVDAATFANPAYPRSMYNPLVNPGRNFTAKLTHTF